VTAERLSWVKACEMARDIVAGSPDMERLYRRAVKYHGEGELRHGIMAVASDVLQEKDLSDEVFLNSEGMLCFFCGIWMQFLLTEIAGVKKEDLRAIAMKALAEVQDPHSLH
jgi:hypothetical protein